MNNQQATRRWAPVAGLRSSGLDAVLGAAAGAAGVWAMDQIGWFMLGHENPQTLTRDLAARDKDAAGKTGMGKQVRAVQAAAPGSAATAGAFKKATQVSGVSPTDQQPGTGAALFHYALGMLPGALYAAARRKRPSVGTGSGALYGLALFVVMDETLAPLTGIAAPPGRYPWQAHTRGLAAHLVLGMTTETLLRATDRLQ
ncbi:DUF1440 domain-containing protein [Pseudarthrobacter sp. NS4]|uniref:DUF1440 domain-containing protein n=1 Tax=Pseudarthrobacter sp. NS4 TaxID=2973976 RepID=UPI002163602B|nr:DUF1440 domain-containing protein [Pseudarthrobacter sp. NS4]